MLRKYWQIVHQPTLSVTGKWHIVLEELPRLATTSKGWLSLGVKGSGCHQTFERRKLSEFQYYSAAKEARTVTGGVAEFEWDGRITFRGRKLVIWASWSQRLASTVRNMGVFDV